MPMSLATRSLRLTSWRRPSVRPQTSSLTERASVSSSVISQTTFGQSYLTICSMTVRCDVFGTFPEMRLMLPSSSSSMVKPRASALSRSFSRRVLWAFSAISSASFFSFGAAIFQTCRPVNHMPAAQMRISSNHEIMAKPRLRLARCLLCSSSSFSTCSRERGASSVCSGVCSCDFSSSLASGFSARRTSNGIQRRGGHGLSASPMAQRVEPMVRIV